MSGLGGAMRRGGVPCGLPGGGRDLADALAGLGGASGGFPATPDRLRRAEPTRAPGGEGAG